MAIASASVFPLSSQAAQVTGAFTVTAAFTPTCTIAVAARTIAFTYTAFGLGLGPTVISAPVVLTCSRGIGALATVAYDGGNAAGLIGATNLRYTLSAITPTPTPGTAATGTTVGTVGTADTVSYSFSASLPTQAGGGVTTNPAVLINATSNRTLIVTF